MKRVWTEEKIAVLRRLYPTAIIASLAMRLGVSVSAVRSKAKVLKLKRTCQIHMKWNIRHVAYLKRHYADAPIEELVENTKHNQKSIWNKARSLGLHRSKEYLREVGLKHSQHPNAIATRFKPGREPHNKGKRIDDFMSADGIKASSTTRWKKGHVPHNRRAIGSEVVHADGYIYLKTEQGPVAKHRWLWEQANGPIPKGHIVVFRDGNPQNCELDNLKLISRQDHARNAVKRETPEQRKARRNKAMVTQKKNIRRDVIRLKYGMKPLGKLVKRWWLY